MPLACCPMDAKPGSVVLKFQLSYQACNDSLCRAPQTLELPLSSERWEREWKRVRFGLG